ncbi:MAG: penicillin-binding transpeptidase domain-containing protein [Bacillota bacterium]|nr:penicillin-binding transpeptidase domain-containing protein [Bacillota bacterium]
MSGGRIVSRQKMAIVLIIVLLAFAVVVGKLFYIQFIQGSELQQKAEELRTRDLPVAAARGTIYDANGNKLAISITADSISAAPPEVIASGQAEITAEFLAEKLDCDYADIYDSITGNSSFAWVERKVDFELAEEIRAAELPGIYIVGETQRYYPRGTLASFVLGCAGIDNQGLEGLELTLEDWLAGESGRIVSEYDANGNPIPQAEYEYIAPTDGYDVYITIDENVQYFCERELSNLMESDTPPKQAGIIIMRPDTGEIVALACSSGFDPNNYQDYTSAERRNFLINDSYEPGSTFKIITAATALEEGVVSEADTFYDPGYVTVSGSTIHCWASVPHGSQSLAEAIKNSCNPAFVSIGHSIENKADGLFYKYIQAFGYGAQTGVDLPGEAEGILQAEENVNAVEIATIAIGQGIAVTPMQMITAASAVANDGVLLRPQLVSEVRDGSKVIYQSSPEVVRRVISAETAQQLRRLLTAVVSDGSGANAAIEGYSIAGKTGTAQKAGDGGYVAGKYVASFIGMVPAEDPELVCLVVVDEPSGVFYGSQVAAPIFKAVMTDTLRYFGITPSVDSSDTVTEPLEYVTVPDVINLDIDTASIILRESGLNPSIRGNGVIVEDQTPVAGTSVLSGTTVAVDTADISVPAGSLVTVPDLRGMRIAEAASTLSALGVKLIAEGSGVAVSQSPQPGTTVTSGSSVTVVFSEPAVPDAENDGGVTDGE